MTRRAGTDDGASDRGLGARVVACPADRREIPAVLEISALVFDAREPLRLAEATGYARDRRLLRFVKTIERDADAEESRDRDD